MSIASAFSILGTPLIDPCFQFGY